MQLILWFLRKYIFVIKVVMDFVLFKFFVNWCFIGYVMIEIK